MASQEVGNDVFIWKRLIYDTIDGSPTLICLGIAIRIKMSANKSRNMIFGI